jgi:single-strand selective monofunctional uracil DNA glycosylase
MARDTTESLIEATHDLADGVDRLRFAAPVRFVYNPARYARAPYEMYLRRFATTTKRALLLGMNPGPWGMAQTGIPFGEVHAVRDWMGIESPIGQPPRIHPKRPIVGFDVTRNEASGKRLWGLMKQRYPGASDFFRHHFVINYCPLLLYDADGRNITPDKLNKAQRNALFAVCDAHLGSVVETLKPHWVIGIGKFAEGRIEAIAESHTHTFETAGILHPSPASPLANKNWAGDTVARLEKLGVW